MCGKRSKRKKKPSTRQTHLAHSRTDRRCVRSHQLSHSSDCSCIESSSVRYSVVENPSERFERSVPFYFIFFTVPPASMKFWSFVFLVAIRNKTDLVVFFSVFAFFIFSCFAVTMTVLWRTMGKRNIDHEAVNYESSQKKRKVDAIELSPTTEMSFSLTTELVDGVVLTDLCSKKWRCGKPIGMCLLRLHCFECGSMRCDAFSRQTVLFLFWLPSLSTHQSELSGVWRSIFNFFLFRFNFQAKAVLVKYSWLPITFCSQ